MFLDYLELLAVVLNTGCRTQGRKTTRNVKKNDEKKSKLTKNQRNNTQNFPKFWLPSFLDFFKGMTQSQTYLHYTHIHTDM